MRYVAGIGNSKLSSPFASGIFTQKPSYTGRIESDREYARPNWCEILLPLSIVIVNVRASFSFRAMALGLNGLGFSVEKLKENGLIVVSDGHYNLSEQLEFMLDIIANCTSNKGFRLLGDMLWAVEKGWSLDEINRLEMKTNEDLAGDNKLFLCQYDLAHFGADSALMAFDTHSLTVYRGEVKQSPYFVESTE